MSDLDLLLYGYELACECVNSAIPYKTIALYVNNVIFKQNINKSLLLMYVVVKQGRAFSLKEGRISSLD